MKVKRLHYRTPREQVDFSTVMSWETLNFFFFWHNGITSPSLVCLTGCLSVILAVRMAVCLAICMAVYRFLSWSLSTCDASLEHFCLSRKIKIKGGDFKYSQMDKSLQIYCISHSLILPVVHNCTRNRYGVLFFILVRLKPWNDSGSRKEVRQAYLPYYFLAFFLFF